MNKRITIILKLHHKNDISLIFKSFIFNPINSVFIVLDINNLL